MGCRGVHFALTNEEAERLLAAAASGDAVDYLEEEIEEQWNEDWLVETDKAWDVIHRCLTDGKLKKSANPIEQVHSWRNAVASWQRIYHFDSNAGGS